MSVAVPTASGQRHIVGDLVVRYYDFTVTDGDTFVVPQDSIRQVQITPTTNVAVGASWAAGSSGQVITFHGTFTGRVAIWTRKG